MGPWKRLVPTRDAKKKEKRKKKKKAYIINQILNSV